jgi:transcriptional regulator with XRE-family HTH domain
VLSEARMITRLQVRMARTALGWGVRDLADRTGLSPTTVSRFENGHDARMDTVRQIQDVLERAGVIFVPGDENAGPGVRLRDPPRHAISIEPKD